MALNPDIKVLRVKKFPIYDIFQGEGWEDWTRVLQKHGKLVVIGGQHLTVALLRSLSTHISQQQLREPNAN